RELLHFEGTRQMDGIEAPQSAALRELPSPPRDLRRQLDYNEALEIAIERGDSTRECASRNAPLALAPRERCAGLRIRDTGSRDQRCSVETDSRLIRPGFPDVELHQGTRVQIQDQRRSSTTASDTDEPRTRGALSRPSGLPPDHASRPLFASVRTTTSSSPSGLAGTMMATALFRSVTVTV